MPLQTTPFTYYVVKFKVTDQADSILIILFVRQHDIVTIMWWFVVHDRE